MAQQDSDAVNHPAHYTSDPSGIECIEITRHRNFNIGNAFKYLWRSGLKDDATEIEDLEKAVWYINDEIARLRRQQQAQAAPNTEAVLAAVRRAQRREALAQRVGYNGRRPGSGLVAARRKALRLRGLLRDIHD